MLFAAVGLVLLGATSQTEYYAHGTVVDEHGVIAPWYTGQNGQFDYRVRIAAETIKRYPWCTPPDAIMAAPIYVMNGTWNIAEDGTITPRPLRDWDTGDLGQRLAYTMSALVDYYRYSGDPAAIAHCTYIANYILQHDLTGADHPWPRFPISVPTKGVPYGAASPDGMIQLDIAAEMAIGLLQAYKLTGEKAWLDACTHWAELLAQHRNTDSGIPPWNRYANPGQVDWDDKMTGGIVYLLWLFDDLISMDIKGQDDCLVAARDQGLAYFKDVLLPLWTVDDTWGRNYWDWTNPVMCETVTDFAARFMLNHPDDFPNWRNDVRNILGLFLNRTGVSPKSAGDTFSGAWAFPESSACCGRSLWYAPTQLAVPFAQYGVLADDPWALEIARRAQLLTTYDIHETGVVEDIIDGGIVVAGGWFKIAHPMMLKHVLGTMAWLPDIEGANRENHIMRTTSVVSHVHYGDGHVAYRVFDARRPAIDVLRLAFVPTRVLADGKSIKERTDLAKNGYAVKPLGNGDVLLTIRHDGRTDIVVEGDDPQSMIPIAEHRLSAPADEFSTTFEGNQVRVIGSVGPEGGLATIELDGEEQLVGIDCWNPQPREGQVLYFRNGLGPGEHLLRIVARGEGNPVSEGTSVYLNGIEASKATGDAGFGIGGGPSAPQRMVFGYGGRDDLVDTNGHRWRPATDWVMRTGHRTDVVEAAWWTEPTRLHVGGTENPQLYRYGVHGPEFWINLTAAPGTYSLTLKFADTHFLNDALITPTPIDRAVTILINGEVRVTDMDIVATAGGYNRATDLVFNDVRPLGGIIEVRLRNDYGGEASLQALELNTGPSTDGAKPVAVKSAL